MSNEIAEVGLPEGSDELRASTKNLFECLGACTVFRTLTTSPTRNYPSSRGGLDYAQIGFSRCARRFSSNLSPYRLTHSGSRRR